MTEQYRPIPEQLNDLFLCLANRQRRLIIDCLNSKPDPVLTDDLVQYIQMTEGGEKEDIRGSLHHNHLPRMTETGVIDPIDRTGIIQPGDQYEPAVHVLETAWRVFGDKSGGQRLSDGND